MNKPQFKQYVLTYGYPVFKVSVDYVSSSSDYVDDSDRGQLHTLEVTARTYSEYISFFKEVEKLMRKQCDCPAGQDDYHVDLSPVFRIAIYRSEREFSKNSPRTYSFVKFKDEFYDRVRELRSR